MFNRIFLLFSCNAWKERATMRLVMATTVKETFDGAIVKELAAQNMGFFGLNGTNAVDAFQKGDIGYGGLEYGYVEVVGDGEYQ